MERNVIGLLAKGEYPSFMQEVRPQIYDLLTRFDAYLEKRGPKTTAELKSASAVSLEHVRERGDGSRARGLERTRLELKRPSPLDHQPLGLESASSTRGSSACLCETTSCIETEIGAVRPRSNALPIPRSVVTRGHEQRRQG